MIKIETTSVYGWEAAVRGMRNPMNSWDQSDSSKITDDYEIGEKDLDLQKLQYHLLLPIVRFQ